MRILFIDDNIKDFELLFRGICARDCAGAEVHVADNGPEGLRKYEQVRPELVVVDYQMPGMNGEEVARELRDRYGPVPNIALFSGTVDWVTDRKLFDKIFSKDNPYALFNWLTAWSARAGKRLVYAAREMGGC